MTTKKPAARTSRKVSGRAASPAKKRRKSRRLISDEELEELATEELWLLYRQEARRPP